MIWKHDNVFVMDLLNSFNLNWIGILVNFFAN